MTTRLIFRPRARVRERSPSSAARAAFGIARIAGVRGAGAVPGAASLLDVDIGLDADTGSRTAADGGAGSGRTTTGAVDAGFAATCMDCVFVISGRSAVTSGLRGGGSAMLGAGFTAVFWRG